MVHQANLPVFWKFWLMCSGKSLYHSCSRMGSSMGFRGSSALTPAACPPFSLTLVPTGLFVSHFLYNSCFTVTFTLSFPKYYQRYTTSITGGLSLCQQWVHFGTNYNWLCPTWGQLLASSNRRQKPVKLSHYQSSPHKQNTLILIVIKFDFFLKQMVTCSL